jgi:SAM-dependent methyltransferase
MDAGQNPWDEDYRRRGRLWGGSASFLPRLAGSFKILELGCGDGKTTASLVLQGCSVTAIDRSPRAASLCRNSCADPDRVGILIADSTRTPFCNESFDVIIASHIVGHLSRDERHRQAFEVLRLLVCGGTFWFCDFSTGDFRCGRGAEIEEGTFMRKNGISTHYFADDEVPALFTGLAVQSLVQHRWEMRIRGRVFPRAEIVAEFKKRAWFPRPLPQTLCRWEVQPSSSRVSYERVNLSRLSGPPVPSCFCRDTGCRIPYNFLGFPVNRTQ